MSSGVRRFVHRRQPAASADSGPVSRRRADGPPVGRRSGDQLYRRAAGPGATGDRPRHPEDPGRQPADRRLAGARPAWCPRPTPSRRGPSGAQTAATIPTARDRLHQRGQPAGRCSTGQAPGALRADMEATRRRSRAAPMARRRIPADTLRQRPDVRAAERSLAAATAQIGVAEAALIRRSRSPAASTPPRRTWADLADSVTGHAVRRPDARPFRRRPAAFAGALGPRGADCRPGHLQGRRC